MKKIIVTWIDSHAISNWDTKQEYVKFAKTRKTIESIGFLLEDNKDFLVLVQSSGNNQVDNGIMIYKKAIIKKWKLSAKKHDNL